MDACCRVGGLARDDGSRNFSRILTGNGMASDKERPARVAERGWKRPPSFAYPCPTPTLPLLRALTTASMIRFSDATCPPHTTTTVRDADVIPMRRAAQISTQQQQQRKAPLEQSHRRAYFSISRVDHSGLRHHHHPPAAAAAPLLGFGTWQATRGPTILSAVQQHGPRSDPALHAIFLIPCNSARHLCIPASRASTPWDRFSPLFPLSLSLSLAYTLVSPRI